MELLQLSSDTGGMFGGYSEPPALYFELKDPYLQFLI